MLREATPAPAAEPAPDAQFVPDAQRQSDVRRQSDVQPRPAAQPQPDAEAVPAEDRVTLPVPVTEPTDAELDARSRRILADLPPLEEALERGVPLTLLADLLSPYGPDSERIAREER